MQTAGWGCVVGQVVVVAPCGFKTDKALEQARQLVESK